MPVSEPTYSEVEYYPPLPHRYINPIVDVGTYDYDSVQNIPDASLYYPEHILQSASHQALPFFQKITEGDNNKLTLETASYTIDYSSDLKGGDALSGSTRQTPGALPGQTYSNFWNSNAGSHVNPTSGFIDTWINQVESGYVPNTRTMPMAFLQYVKNEINYGGEGVHRQVIAEYRNHEFSYRNYLKSKAYRKDNGEEISDAYRDMYISSLGELGESNPDYALLGGLNINSIIGSFVDPRFDNMYLYSPENKKLFTYNGTSATNSGEETHYFSALPPIPNPTNITKGSMNYTLKGPISDGSVPVGSNFLSISEAVGSGTPEDPIENTFTRLIQYGDDLFLDSSQVLSIFERSSDNPGGLVPQAVGFYVVLGRDRFSSVGKTDYLTTDNIIMTVFNGMTSGLNGSKNVSAAHAAQFAQDKWQDNGDRINFAPVEGTVWQAISTGSPRVPKGWVAKHFLRINGSDKDDVINKLENYLANNTFPAAIDAKDELPEVLLNYEHPLKGGKIY